VAGLTKTGNPKSYIQTEIIDHGHDRPAASLIGLTVIHVIMYDETKFCVLQVNKLISRWSVVYSVQHYVKKFVSDLRQVDGFLQVLWFPPPIKLTATI
jgi:hypothetical protein